jgi:hypothetical protein
MLPNFNNSKMQASITHHGSFGNVVKACYETCEEPVAFVTYATLGSDFLITSFTVHPRASVKEARASGDAIDAALEQEASKHGIKRLLIVLPDRPDKAEEVRTYAIQPLMMRQLPQIAKPFYLN